MNTLPLISIILPTYNRAKVLPLAIESILVQTYSNIELIIIDDGSIDNTEKIVKNYTGNIKYFYKKNHVELLYYKLILNQVDFVIGSFDLKYDGPGRFLRATNGPLPPLAQAPQWFVEKISIKPKMQIISLDDDVSIHQIWRERFSQHKNIEQISFTSGEKFKTWFKSTENISHHQLFLMDLELLNQSSSGLDIIVELNIAKQSVLVTSHYDEQELRARCEKLGIKLLPKPMAGFVPIQMDQASFNREN